ncbi:MAG: ATPase, partial [bacterium]
LSRDEWELYDQSMVFIQDQRGAAEAALEKGLAQGERIGMEKGLAQGEKIGLEKGLAQGEKIGMEKGERMGRLEAARKLFQAGIDPKIIRDSTGISEEEFENEH